MSFESHVLTPMSWTFHLYEKMLYSLFFLNHLSFLSFVTDGFEVDDKSQL